MPLNTGKFAIKENAKEPKFRTAKNVGLIAGGTGMWDWLFSSDSYNLIVNSPP